MTENEPATLTQLRELAASALVADRAFADAMLRMQWSRASPGERESLVRAHAELQVGACVRHAPLRAAIADGSLRGAALRRAFEQVPQLWREHFVEEVLGIAYPPLDEVVPEQDAMSYAASGYDEIVYAFDTVGLSETETLLDLGSGMGKVVLLAVLLCGARAVGVERDARLAGLAQRAARDLNLEPDWIVGDARSVQLPVTSVVFAYLPFSGPVRREVLARLWPRDGDHDAPRWLCSGPISPGELPSLAPRGAARSWLQVYGPKAS